MFFPPPSFPLCASVAMIHHRRAPLLLHLPYRCAVFFCKEQAQLWRWKHQPLSGEVVKVGGILGQWLMCAFSVINHSEPKIFVAEITGVFDANTVTIEELAQPGFLSSPWNYGIVQHISLVWMVGGREGERVLPCSREQRRYLDSYSCHCTKTVRSLFQCFSGSQNCSSTSLSLSLNLTPTHPHTYPHTLTPTHIQYIQARQRAVGSSLYELYPCFSLASSNSVDHHIKY